MSAQELQLWRMVRRGLLLIATAIEKSESPSPLFLEVRRGCLLIARAIEQECKATEMV